MTKKAGEDPDRLGFRGEPHTLRSEGFRATYEVWKGQFVGLGKAFLETLRHAVGDSNNH